MQGSDDLVGWLHTEMVQPPEDGTHTSTNAKWVNFVHATNTTNHYATPPTMEN